MSFAILIVLALPVILAGPSLAQSFKLENGYFSLSGKDGAITSLRLDPAGKSRFGRSHIISYRIGDPIPDPATRAEIDSSGTRAVLKGAKIGVPTRIEQLEANSPELLTPGHAIGQSFVWEHGFLNAVEAKMPTWNTTDSAVTMTLYRIENGNRAKVVSARLENLKDNEWAGIKCPDQPPGTYLVELSDVKGMAGWWTAGHDVIKGEATADGVPHPAMDRAIRCIGHDVHAGDVEITLDRNKLRTRFAPSGDSAGGRGSGRAAEQLQTVLTIPWVKSGYDTTGDRIIFHHFLTSEGIYVPAHQLKRRPWSGVSGEWVLMSGRFGADLRFPNAPIHLSMTEDSMSLDFPGADREIELLPHTDELPEGFPSFFSSEPKTDRVLNEFLLSHNFNFGVGTNPDWKDWHTLQLSWTANHQADLQHLQFLSYRIDPDGYVYCWGADPGWPFPYKDEGRNGRNDYDTRHWTTNPCYILGAWREYCWNPDPEYLAKLMPRVRLAMEFILKECDGDRGVMIAKGKGHEGRDRDIGSNYWDITPFGWKDAFTNAHYYPSLEAMAQLEEAVLRDPDVRDKLKGTSPTPRSPRYYRRLAETVRKSYNDTFWLEDRGRYSGCVDVEGVTHDYGFTFVNLPAMAYGLADPDQVRRIYDWMENSVTSSGKRDTYSRWVFAPRASTVHNPKRDEPPSSVRHPEPIRHPELVEGSLPSWWCMVWNGTGYDEQCQDGGAILYTSFHDILARARFLGADNAWKRLTEILARYSESDHLSGGTPLYRGEVTQGGPGGTAGSVGVEGEFPESGLVPVSFLYAFLGIDADIDGLEIRPNLPSSLRFAGVRNLRYNGLMYDIRVTSTSVELSCTTKGRERVIRKSLAPGEVFRANALNGSHGICRGN